MIFFSVIPNQIAFITTAESVLTVVYDQCSALLNYLPFMSTQEKLDMRIPYQQPR